MKRILATIGLACGVAAASGAADFGLGLHGAYPLGGDIEEASAGFGAQADYRVTERFALELSGTQFGDEMEYGGDLEVQTFAISARLGTDVAEKTRVYGGAGVSYNLYDADAPDYREALADNYGVLVDQMLADFAERGVTLSGASDADLDDSFGFHVFGGGSYLLLDNVELFAEYRLTFTDLEGSVTHRYVRSSDGLEIDRGILGANVDESYAFGLLRIGVNFLF